MADGTSEAVLAELRAEIARQGRKTAALAAVLGRSRGTASRKLHGHIGMSVGEVMEVARWLGISLDEIAERAKARTA